MFKCMCNFSIVHKIYKIRFESFILRYVMCYVCQRQFSCVFSLTKLCLKDFNFKKTPEIRQKCRNLKKKIYSWSSFSKKIYSENSCSRDTTYRFYNLINLDRHFCLIRFFTDKIQDSFGKHQEKYLDYIP